MVRPAGGFNKIATTFQPSSRNLLVTAQRQLAARTKQETTMNPSTVGQLGQARLAAWHQQAERDRIARAARSARRNRASHLRPGHLATILASRARAALGTPSRRPPAQPGQAPKATP